MLRLVISELEWKEYPNGRKGPCDFYWHPTHFSDPHHDVLSGRVNKFPGMAEIAHKINLTRALDNMRLLFPDEYDFYPRSWFLPDQFHDFAADSAYAQRQNPKLRQTYIVKPDAGTQGEGIYLISDPRDYEITKKERHVVQEYVSNPLLMDGLKFDLRVYVVVLGLDPLRIYLCRDGLARFATEPYARPTSKNIDRQYMHLTNYSLNRWSDTYKHTDRLHDGSKRTLTSVLHRLAQRGCDADAIWQDIEKVVVKTIMAMVAELKLASLAEPSIRKRDVSCFQILGFDILLTDRLRPVLLEVNASPSLSITFERQSPTAPGVVEQVPSYVDEYVKRPLIRESLLLAMAAAPPPTDASRAPPRRRSDDGSSGADDDPDGDDDDDAAAVGGDGDGDGAATPGADDALGEERVLYELYPRLYAGSYERLRVLERLAKLYQRSLGLRGGGGGSSAPGSCYMTANNFRMFARKCRIVQSDFGVNMATLDILFIEMQKKWSVWQPEDVGGLSFQGFIDAFLSMGKRSKLRSTDCLEMLRSTLDYCEANLKLHAKSERRRLPKLAPPRLDVPPPPPPPRATVAARLKEIETDAAQAARQLNSYRTLLEQSRYRLGGPLVQSLAARERWLGSDG